MGYNKRMPTNNQPFIVSHKALSLSVIAVIIFSVSGVAWWKHVYNSPRRVFEGMLRTNLSTASVTRTTVLDQQGGTVEKVEQLSFVPTVAGRTADVIKQQSAEGDTNVIRETIGTTTKDYIRYISIRTAQKGANGKPLNYDPVLNIWGESAQAQSYQKTVLGLIPFANLKPADVDAMFRKLQDKKVYTVDYSKVEPKRIDGKSTLVFAVTINTAQYVEVIKDIAKTGGFNDFADLNPADYKDSAPIEVKLTVDKLSRHLLEADFVASAQKETYSAYGLSTPVSLPSKTIPLELLQQQVQEVK